MATTFDFYIHPSHGLDVAGTFKGSNSLEETSAAEKLLAALARQSTEYEDDDDDATVCDLVMDGSEAGDLSDFSSLDTPSSSFSDLQQIKDDSTFSFFPQVEASSSPAVHLERIKSASFTPDEALLQSTLAPLSEDLQAQLSAAREQRSGSPTFGGFSMIPLASTSSGMMRSFSAPVQSLVDYKLIMNQWNEEAAAASTSAQGDNELPDSPRRHYSGGRPNMQRRATSSSLYSARKGKMPAPSPAATFEDGHSRYADAGEHDPPAMQDTFSSRDHLLSPTKKHSPFKRSRLSYSMVHRSTVYEDPREADYSASRPTTPQTAEQTAPQSPPKSPSRPALNRHYTSPEFWTGSDVQGEEVF